LFRVSGKDFLATGSGRRRGELIFVLEMIEKEVVSVELIHVAVLALNMRYGWCEVWIMRCVIQVRRSFDVSGQHFVLRVYPQYRSEERHAESFTNSRTLVERLATLGVPKMDPIRSFPNLGGVLDAIWTNIEVPDGAYEKFGRFGGRSYGERMLSEQPSTAA
jgi:hypothetical protein